MGTTSTKPAQSPLSTKPAEATKTAPAAKAAQTQAEKPMSAEERKAQRKAAKQAEREQKKLEREKAKAEKPARKPFRAEDAAKVKGVPGKTEGLAAYDPETTLPPRRADFEVEADFYEWKAIQAEETAKYFREKAEESRLTGGAAKSSGLKKLEKMAKEIEALKAKVKTDNPDMDLDAFLASLKSAE